MSDSQRISLQELTKEDYKNMAKQREKAKRDQDAKQAKISATFGEPAMPASVSFPAPVKVAGEDANIGRIMGVRFEDFSNIMKQCRTTDVVGVERQPATPLPGKSVDRKFFNSSSASRNLDYYSSSSRSNRTASQSQNSVNSRNDVKYSNKPGHNTVGHHEGKGKSASSSLASKMESGHNRTKSSDRSSLPNSSQQQKPDQKPESSSSHDHNKLVTSDHSKSERGPTPAHSSSRKELMPQNVKHPPNRTREPVLQTMKKELIGQTKPESNQTSASNQKTSSSKAMSENNKDVRQAGDARTVLKEKEENRNADGTNGAKQKNRPKLHIPENVEEMLKEFQVPQPLTGIQTPFKESQFPFSDKIQDRKDLNVVGKSSKDLMKSLSEMSTHSNETSKTTVVEEIQDSFSSSSSSSEGEEDDDDDDSSVGANVDHDNEGFDIDRIMETGEHPSNSEPVKPTVSTNQGSSEKRKSFIAEKVPPLSTETAVPKTSEETESHGMGQSCSSSESSSSGSESDSDNSSDSESDKDVSDDENRHPTPQGTPNNPDNMETSPSSGSKRWNLGAFLQRPQLSKPPSCEAPASNKSDHFEEDTEMKRGADHISDENPPSVDQDLLSKPMSGEEFSPPAPIESKHILSPIKSPLARPIKSPLPAIISPLQYHTPKAAEKGFPPSVSANETSNRNKTVDRGKHKDSNTLPSKSVTDASETKGRRPRKKKQNIVSVATIDTSDSDSDIEVDILNRSSDSALSSPQKPLPLNSQLSQKYPPLDRPLCSANLGTVKRKETKREKLLKEKDSVKLKREIAMASVPSKDCDSSKKASRMCARSFTDSIDDMLNTFSGEKPLSPIQSVTNMHKINPTEQDLIRAGLNVSTKKTNSFTGNVSCAREKPPVLVKIDLNLLDRVLCVDRHSPNFLKPKEHSSVKHHKKVTSAKYSSSEIRSKKVHKDTVKDKISKLTASKLSANNTHIPDIDLSDKKYVPEKERISNPSWTTKKDIPNSHVPSFESLPVREAVKRESLSDNLCDSDSDGSASEIEDSKLVESMHDSLSTSNHSSFSPSPREKKKRKLTTPRDEDTKRQKTLSKSPASTPASEMIKESQPVEINVPWKRERHSSASSQHSTVSNVSQRSSHSQKGSQGHRSQKRARTHDDCGGGVGQSYSGLRPSSVAINRPHDRSKSTAVVTPVVKYETLDTPSQNGFIVHNPPFYRSMLSDKEEEERLLPAEDYNRKAKKYKYQADDMDPGLTKFVLYLESVLCFIQYGYAHERDHKITEASNMYKETYRFISHQFHQFRMYHDSEASDKAHKLTVLCLRIQSLVYLKLYLLKKNETVKLKRILEDHNNKGVKSSSQPKAAPSAPSPHQPSWNRSTGTPSPMSPTPSPANSVCSVGSVGSDVTPSKISNGSSGQGGQIAPPGSVIVPQRIHSITQKYFSNTCYLIQAHELWDQATSNIISDNREFFAQLDLDCGPLTLHSSLLHLVRYVKQAISQLNL